MGLPATEGMGAGAGAWRGEPTGDSNPVPLRSPSSISSRSSRFLSSAMVGYTSGLLWRKEVKRFRRGGRAVRSGSFANRVVNECGRKGSLRALYRCKQRLYDGRDLNLFCKG